MPTDSHHSQALLGETLLAQLRLAGFTVTEEHYVRLFSLLDRLEGQCHLQDLRTLLCPIFATDREEQESFYKVFDQWYPHTTASKADASDEKPSPTGTTSPESPPHPPPNPTDYLAVAMGVVIVLGGILWFFWPEIPPQLITPNGTLVGIAPGPDTSAPPSQDLKDQLSEKRPEAAGLTPQTTPDTKSGKADEPSQASALAPEQATPTPALFTQLRNWFFSLSQLHIYAVILVALLCLMASIALRRHYKQKRRRWALKVLGREKQLQPPFSWPLQAATNTHDIFNIENYRTAARELRKPYRSDIYRLDIPATISATIASAGYPELRYKVDNQSPEYLALIDRISNRDHQAQAYVQLTKLLERHGVYFSRWFYESDPRVCWDEQFSSSLSLEELAARYGQSRLLLFGDGAWLQDASTGELHPWTDVFANWKDRAILTPRTPEAWGDPEFFLATSFIVLPATSRGLVALAEQYESAGIATLRSIDDRKPVPSLFFSPLETDDGINDAVRELNNYLGKEGFRWICACALHPELHWDVTLRLGALPELGTNPLTEQMLLRLIRLPWFRTGKLPIALRQRLVERGNPSVMHAASQLLITILERNTPPKGTFAFDRHKITLAFQRWLIDNSSNNKAALRAQLGAVPVSSVSLDPLAEILLQAPGQAGGRAVFPAPVRPEETAATEAPGEHKSLGSTWKMFAIRCNLAIQSFLSSYKGSKNKETPTRLFLSFLIASIAVIASAQYIPWANLLSLLSGPRLMQTPSQSPTSEQLSPNSPPANIPGKEDGILPLPPVKPSIRKPTTEVPSLPSGITPVEISTIGLYDIFFQRNSRTLDSEAKNRLQQNAAILLNNPALEIRLEGHTDERTTSAYAMVIASLRARAVIRYLVSLGVKNSFSISDMGKEKPFCTQHTESCYQLNNRVHFIVREGSNTPPTSPDPISPAIKNIVFLGNSAFDDAVLRANSKLKIGSKLDQTELKLEVQRLIDFYDGRGYVLVNITPSVTTNKISGDSVVTLTIREDHQFRVGQITIKGNDQTSDGIIRSQLTLKETDILSSRSVKESFQRLLNLGIFDAVEILPQMRNADTIDLVVTVKEKPPGDGSPKTELGIKEFLTRPQEASPSSDRNATDSGTNQQSTDTIPPSIPTNPTLQNLLERPQSTIDLQTSIIHEKNSPQEKLRTETNSQLPTKASQLEDTPISSGQASDLPPPALVSEQILLEHNYITLADGADDKGTITYRTREPQHKLATKTEALRYIEDLANFLAIEIKKFSRIPPKIHTELKADEGGTNGYIILVGAGFKEGLVKKVASQFLRDYIDTRELPAAPSGLMIR